jgi:GNAT superfamily N-acetyltransferase
MSGVTIIREISGSELEPWLDALGTLRIRVFREYPYLYDGTLEYERNYLRIYQKSPLSRVILVTDTNGGLIGATTCLPLAEEAPEFQAPFVNAGRRVDDCLYFGESIVLPEWRGHGLGKEFFVRREAHARRLGLTTTAFCAVDRPDDHPLRPKGYRPLDEFWKARGYTKQPGLQAEFTWKQIGEVTESAKTLTFWTRTWTT